jgi:hypothetical protein
MTKEEAKTKLELFKLAKQARRLYKQDQTSAKELGAVLLKVRGLKPEGGVIKWIRKNVGKDVKALNRCKYALSLVDPDSTRGKKSGRNRTDSEFKKLIFEVHKAFGDLVNHVKNSEVGAALTCRNIIVSRADELVQRAKDNAKVATNTSPSVTSTEEKAVAAHV